MAVDLKSPKAITLIVALAVIVLAAGAGIGYLLMKPSLDAAEKKLSEAESALESTEDSATASDDATLPVEVEESGPEEPEDADDDATAEPDGRYPGIITSIDAAGSGWEIVIDYVQVLTGAEANAEAAARGDETPVPNDYYVVNDNPRLRTIPVSSVCAVLMHDTPAADPADGIVMGDVTLTFDDFRVDRWGALSYYRDAIYWIDIADGEITNIEHFWVP